MSRADLVGDGMLLAYCTLKKSGTETTIADIEDHLAMWSCNAHHGKQGYSLLRQLVQISCLF